VPRHTEKLLTKYDPHRIVKAKDHLDTFYLHLQTLEVHYGDVASTLFPCTLDGRETVLYHSLHIKSIQKWGMFLRIFLEKYDEDKIPAMLLKELGSLKMEQKEKVKDFNQMFNRILNKFTAYTKPHDSITTNYYTSTPPTNIAQFVK